MDLVPVKFLKSDGRYYPGDVAGFIKPMADALVKGGKAIYVEVKEPQRRSKEHVKVTK